MNNMNSDSFKNVFKRYLQKSENNYANKQIYSVQKFSMDSVDTPQVVTRSAGSLSENRLEIMNKDASIIREQSVQTLFRPYFGKQGINKPEIGDHPDFKYLRDTGGSEYCPITTMFMDIVNSTGLGLMYPLEQVFIIKNAFISAAIEIVKTFDGHVHRIMGDAIMAFFGGKSGSTEDNTINALNCASTLMYFVENAIIPALAEYYPTPNGSPAPFAVRIGIDHGKEKDVLWGCYGHTGINEVTATSIYVDMAAKLQHCAGKNQIMLGDSLKKHLDLPTPLLSVKVDESGHKEPFILPNQLTSTGQLFNYEKHLFDWKEYLRYTPIPQLEQIMGVKNSDEYIKISAEVSKLYSSDNFNYFPCSFILPKDHEIKFTAEILGPIAYYSRVRFRVENHGLEAELAKDTGGNRPTYEFDVSRRLYTHTERTRYRGLHYLVVEVINSVDQVIKSSRYGVFIA